MSASGNGSTWFERDELAALASDFFDEVLVAAEWFAPINSPVPQWDVLFVGGSAKYGLAGATSDVDLFLVMSRQVQRERRIKPVYLFRYRNRLIEVSQLSTELMRTTQDDKQYLFHWHAGILVKAATNEAAACFRQAASLSDLQLRRIVWTAFADFMILGESCADAGSLGADALAARIRVGSAIQAFVYGFLLTKGRCQTAKWLSLDLLRTDPAIHAALEALIADGHLSKEFFQTMHRFWVDLLLHIGLSAVTDEAWYERNLDLLLFQ